jgi:hypothetical protein
VFEPTIHCTVEPETKLEPVIATEKAVEPTTTLEGDKPFAELIEGDPAVVTVKIIALDDTDEPDEAPGFVTVITNEPAEERFDAGMNAVRLVELT